MALFIVFILLIFVVTAVINLSNFMDGLWLIGWRYVSYNFNSGYVLHHLWPIWCLVGSLIGFIFWNWSPAKVFMGDVGSTFLGAVFAGLVLSANSWFQSLSFFLLAIPLFGDSILCIVRRALAGHNVFKAHRLHLFQRLHQAGWSHSRSH